MTMRYPIAIEIGDEKTAYGVTVPDLPGCFSAGDTLGEAISNAEEAMLLWFDEDVPVSPPAPSKIEDLRRLKEFKNRIWVLVSLDFTRNRPAEWTGSINSAAPELDIRRPRD
jgi:predicted RNase H-like HicB family nuclease